MSRVLAWRDVVWAGERAWPGHGAGGAVGVAGQARTAGPLAAERKARAPGRLMCRSRSSRTASRHQAGGPCRRVCGRGGTGRRRRGLCRGPSERRDGCAGGTGRRWSTGMHTPGCGGTGPGMWSRPLRGRRAVAAPREYASRAGP